MSAVDPPIPLDLPALTARIAAATAGPWRTGRSDMQSYTADGNPFTNIYAGDHPTLFVIGRAFDETGRNKADAALMAYARTDLPACVEIIEALCAALERSILTMTEWYVQDQGSVIGVAQAEVAAEREVAAIRQARAALAQVRR